MLLAVAIVGLSAAQLHADDWPQWLGPQRDGVWRETGIIEKFAADGLKFRWRVPIGGGYTGPAVANGRVYFMDRRVPKGATNPADAFARGEIPGTERVLCLNEADGKILWQHEYNCPYTVSYVAGPRVTPAVADGKVYSLGAEGNLFCLDAEKGTVLWSRAFKKDFGIKTPMWGFAGHPLADGKKLICLVGAPVRSGMTIPTPRKAGDLLFFTSFYNGSLLLRVDSDQPSVVWQSKKVSEKDTDGLHTVMAAPLIENGCIYSPCSYGQFRCLKLETGERLWETFAPTSGKSECWGHAFVVKHSNRSFLFSETGDLIIAKLSPEKYEELSRAHLLDPINHDPGRPVVWSHPAFANRCVYARNDQEIVCVSLAAR